MKPASGPLIAYLNARRKGGQLVYADCYEFVLADDPDTPTILRYTTAQRSVTAVPPEGGDPVTYEAGHVLVSGLKYRLAIGTDVDEQDCQLVCKSDAQVMGFPFLKAVELGLLDKAVVKRTRYFFERWGQPTVGGIVFFRGFLSTVMDIGSISCTAKVKSGLVLLNTPMPHNMFQPQCLNTLFDARCRLDRGDWAVQGDADVGSTSRVIVWAGSTADEYNQGTIRFEAGPNIGAVRTVRQSTSGAILVTFPFDYAPESGDDFVIFPGCDKSKGRCNAFSNIANFRGYPYVPPPETAT